ncbi:hypothetical protein ACO2Q2_13390 [Dyella sp. KRB-257]|uniref:hypothetical protein n=1 Tax=Dyella sp. KRB-257 TaxID=3400915 RepID=UPI003C060271
MSDQTEIDLKHEVRDLTGKVEKLTQQVSGLVEAWNTANGVLKFVKFLGGIATAGAAIWALVKLAMQDKLR